MKTWALWERPNLEWKCRPKPVLPSRRKFRCFVGSTVLYCQGPMGQDNISSLPRGHAFKLTGHRSVPRHANVSCDRSADLYLECVRGHELLLHQCVGAADMSFYNWLIKAWLLGYPCLFLFFIHKLTLALNDSYRDHFTRNDLALKSVLLH